MSIEIQENIILAPYTTFQIGGPARCFCEVSSEEELIEALNYAKDNKLEIFVLGGGSNILVSDKGFNGLVIKLATHNSQLAIKNANKFQDIECWAGESLSRVVKIAADNGLSGLEWAAGIPGSVGGAIRGNAGAFGGCMADNIESVKMLDTGPELSSDRSCIETYSNKDCQFSYRNSIFKQNQNLIIVSCVLNLKAGKKEEIEKEMTEIVKKRAEKQPQGSSAGSFFENPVVKKEIIEQFEKSTGASCKDNKVPAGWLVYETGLKGKKIGNIQVSEKHANFLVNLGGGRAEEVIILASLIKQRVRMKFGVQLREEVKYVGF